MENKTLFLLVILSFLIWLLPFVGRMFFIEVPEMSTELTENHNITKTMDKIVQLLSEKNKQDAFLLIFANNMKGCLLNIVGGVLLGLVTLINLMANGFFMADIFASSYRAGMSIKSILKLTLPHSFELIGFWLSGAIGFYIAWNIILLMQGKEGFNTNFYKNAGVYSLITLLIILAAAYVEVYVSASIN